MLIRNREKNFTIIYQYFNVVLISDHVLVKIDEFFNPVNRISDISGFIAVNDPFALLRQPDKLESVEISRDKQNRQLLVS